jgi:hypothetical protein
MTTLQDYRQIIRNQDRYEQTIRMRPDVQRSIDYFQQNIGKITSADELLKDDKLYRFVMEAFDLSSQIFAKGLMKKVFSEGVTDNHSTANRMNDPKFKEIATVLSFAETGGAPLKEPKVVQAIIDRFVQARLEVSAEETNPAVRLALYFERKAASINNWYQVFADPALQKVVFTVLALPDQTARQDLDRLKDRISTKLDITDFKDPQKVRKFLDRFAAMYDMQNGPAQTSANLAASLIRPLSAGRRASIISIDPATTMALLKFPRF